MLRVICSVWQFLCGDTLAFSFVLGGLGRFGQCRQYGLIQRQCWGFGVWIWELAIHEIEPDRMQMLHPFIFV